MNIIQDIKAFFVVKDAVEEIEKEAKTMNGSTPGYKTTEFWLNLAAQIGTCWAAVSGFIPAPLAAKISLIGVAVYTVARTVIKCVQDVQAANTPATPPTA